MGEESGTEGACYAQGAGAGKCGGGEERGGMLGRRGGGGELWGRGLEFWGGRQFEISEFQISDGRRKAEAKAKGNCRSLDCDARHRFVGGRDAQFALRDGGKATRVFARDGRLGWCG